MDYWLEHAHIAAEEAGIKITDEQANAIAGVIESAHEFYGMSHGHDVASANLAAVQRNELGKAKKDLAYQKEKVVCRPCNGSGWITERGPIHSFTSSCHHCGGEGLIHPSNTRRRAVL